MMRFSLGLRSRLVFLILFTLIPVIGLIVYLASEQERLSMEEAKINMHRLVRLAAGNQERQIEAAHQLLIALSQLQELRGEDPVFCNTFLSELLEEYPVYSNIGAINREGYVYCSSHPLSGRVNFSNSTFFIKTIQNQDFTVSEYQIDGITGKPTMYFGYPVMDENGEVRAVVFVALDLSWVNRLFQEALLPTGSSILALDHSGTIIARYPNDREWAGKSATETELFKAVRSKGNGTAEVTGVDGIKKIFAFTRLVGTGKNRMYLALGAPREHVFKDAKKIFHRSLVALLILAFLAVVAAWYGSHWFVLRRVGVILNATKRLSYGDPNVHTGLTEKGDELGRLAVAFDEMAASLKRRETELMAADRRALEARFTGLLEVAADAILSVDEELRIALFNRGAESIFGYEAREVIGRSLMDLVPERFAETYGQYVYDFNVMPHQARPMLERVEIICRRKDGVEFPTEATFSKLEQNGQTFFTVILRDVTERKDKEKAEMLLIHEQAARAEAEISEERFRSMADAAPVMIWVADTEGRRTYFNKIWLDFRGRTLSEEKGIAWLEGLHPDDVKSYLKMYQDSVKNHRGFSAEYRLKRHDGVFRWVLSSAVPRHTPDGQFVGYIASCIDITERKQTEEKLAEAANELARSNSELEQFAYVTSHDLQEPLRKIVTFSDRLKKLSGLTETERDYFYRMQSAALRMQQLIEDLLQFSRVTKSLKSFERTDLRKIVSEAVTDLDVRISQTNAKIEIGPMPSLLANPMQMRQLFQNLISNALKFKKKEEPPFIRIASRELENGSTGFVEIIVEDNGIGFDERYTDRIFKPFQRLHGRQEYEGTGIGLAICQKIVHAHGGHLTAKSAPGNGARFIISLPNVSEL